jgi:hypothetical protein
MQRHTFNRYNSMLSMTVPTVPAKTHAGYVCIAPASLRGTCFSPIPAATLSSSIASTRGLREATYAGKD